MHEAYVNCILFTIDRSTTGSEISEVREARIGSEAREVREVRKVTETSPTVQCLLILLPLLHYFSLYGVKYNDNDNDAAANAAVSLAGVVAKYVRNYHTCAWCSPGSRRRDLEKAFAAKASAAEA
jgi:hypothetical protein